MALPLHGPSYANISYIIKIIQSIKASKWFSESYPITSRCQTVNDEYNDIMGYIDALLRRSYVILYYMIFFPFEEILYDVIGGD